MLFLTIGSVKSSAYFRDLEPDFLMTKLILIFDPARIWLRKSQNQPTLNDNLMLVQFQLFSILSDLLSQSNIVLNIVS